MRWFKVDEGCEYAGKVSRSTLYQAIRSGQLRAARIGCGRNLLVSDAAIDEWLQNSQRPRGRREDAAANAEEQLPQPAA